jgi:hypothetical protein
LVPVAHGADGGALDLGRRSRTISSALRRMLWLRDRGCRFPGCPNTLYVHAHHIHHWAHGGETNAANLLLICSAHHRALHEGGFSVELAKDGEPVFRDGRKRIVDPSPPPARVARDGAEEVILWNRESGLQIDEETNFPAWNGDDLDMDSVIGALIAVSHPETPANAG